MFAEYYRSRRVLITGHTGFKGAWLSLWLGRVLGAKVVGYALGPPTEPSLHELVSNGLFGHEFHADIRTFDTLKQVLEATVPDVIFHLAAQSLVRRSYREPLETLSTNTLGTANLLEAVRALELPCTVVVVTSDKCYENREWAYAYRETDPLGGHDVYSMSKAAAELTVNAWRRSFFEPSPILGQVATARGGNVLGGGDFSDDRIAPDCYRALAAGRPIRIRHPNAVRPWQHVLDCLSGYLWLGAKLGEGHKASHLASAFNFGPSAESRRTVRELVEAILAIWPGSMECDTAPEDVHEATMLGLDTSKARTMLGWRPAWSFEDTVTQTMAWYRRFHAGPAKGMAEYCVEQIEAYQEAARQQNVVWSL